MVLLGVFTAVNLGLTPEPISPCLLLWLLSLTKDCENSDLGVNCVNESLLTEVLLSFRLTDDDCCYCWGCLKDLLIDWLCNWLRLQMDWRCQGKIKILEWERLDSWEWLGVFLMRQDFYAYRAQTLRLRQRIF